MAAEKQPDFSGYFDGLGLTNSTEAQGMKALIYGASGEGKSTFAAKATLEKDLSPVLFLDTEGGARQPLKDWGDPKQGYVLAVPDWATFGKAWSKIRQDLAKGAFAFKTVVIDTLDVLQEHIRDEGLKEGANKFDIYARVYDRIAAVIKDMSAHPEVNFVCITHATLIEDEVTGATKVGPSFEGSKSAGRIPARFDLVGRLGTEPDPARKGERRTVLVTRSENAVAKKNARHLPDKFVDPSLGSVVEAVRNATK